jgi:hypothetical protein
MKIQKASELHDLSKPVKVEGLLLDADDCYGIEFDPKAFECINCQASASCLKIFHYFKTRPNIHALKEARGEFLDASSFELIDWEKLLNKIKAKVYNYEDVFNFVKNESGYANVDIVHARLMAFCAEHNILKIKDKLIYNG